MIPALTPTSRYREHVAAVDKRSALKNVLGALGLLLLAMFAGSLVSGVGELFGDSENDLVTPIGAVTMALQLAIAAFVFRRAWHITSRDLGFVMEGALGSWLVGALGGIAAITIVWGANYLLGGIDFSPTITASGIGTLVVAVVFFCLQGPFEELLMRSFLMPNVNAVTSPIVAMIVSSAVFMLMHGVNPNMTAMGWVNLFVFGMVFAALYYRTGSIWLVGAAHTTWNLFLGNFWGSHVSGNLVPGSVFESLPRAGHDLLSGGVYGMEGSIVATILGVIVIVLALRGTPSVFARTARPLDGAAETGAPTLPRLAQHV